MFKVATTFQVHINHYNNQSVAIKAVVISFESYSVMKKYVYMLLMARSLP